MFIKISPKRAQNNVLMYAKKSLLKSKKARQRLIVLEGAKFVSFSVCVLTDENWRVEGDVGRRCNCV